MTYFGEFTQNNDTIIAQAANLAEQAATAYKAGNLTQSEYLELCANLFDFHTIAAEVTDMVRKDAIYAAFQAMIEIASTL